MQDGSSSAQLRIEHWFTAKPGLLCPLCPNNSTIAHLELTSSLWFAKIFMIKRFEILSSFIRYVLAGLAWTNCCCAFDWESTSDWCNVWRLKVLRPRYIRPRSRVVNMACRVNKKSSRHSRYSRMFIAFQKNGNNLRQACLMQRGHTLSTHAVFRPLLTPLALSRVKKSEFICWLDTWGVL